MQEKTQMLGNTHLTQIPSDQEKLVVMHPDEAVVTGRIDNRLSESTVDIRVHAPVFDIKSEMAEQIMKKWPDRAVGKAAIISLDLVFGHEHRFEIILLSTAVLGQKFRRGRAWFTARPAYPETTILSHDRIHGRDQTTGGVLYLPGFLFLKNHNRKAV